MIKNNNIKICNLFQENIHNLLKIKFIMIKLLK